MVSDTGKWEVLVNFSKNPDVKIKDGGKANGKKVLIDGQQRVTALMAAVSGNLPVIDLVVCNGTF